MFAITAASFSRDDPLSGLRLVDDHPDPEPPPGWANVRVRAASLNHHDLWSLRGVGLSRVPTVSRRSRQVKLKTYFGDCRCVL